MPQFYFNFRGRVAIADEDGENLPSVIAATQQAIGVARELAQNKQQKDIFDDEIVVADESGQEVFRIPLTSV